MNEIVLGSLSAVARSENKSLAETFLNCDVVIIEDASGSMDIHDSRGHRRRWDVALEELARLQKDLPGKIAVIAFSDEVFFAPGGKPPFLSGGTNLAKALKVARVADVPGIRFIVISDGVPDSEAEALRVATLYQNRIDTVYVGPEEDYEGGRKFLACLANLKQGQAMVANCGVELAAKTESLLLEAA